MTSNMAPIDTNDRWLLKLSSVSPIVSFIPFALANKERSLDGSPFIPLLVQARQGIASTGTSRAEVLGVSPLPVLVVVAELLLHGLAVAIIERLVAIGRAHPQSPSGLEIAAAPAVGSLAPQEGTAVRGVGRSTPPHTASQLATPGCRVESTGALVGWTI
jgi:hypothetical protein